MEIRHIETACKRRLKLAEVVQKSVPFEKT